MRIQREHSLHARARDAKLMALERRSAVIIEDEGERPCGEIFIYIERATCKFGLKVRIGVRLIRNSALIYITQRAAICDAVSVHIKNTAAGISSQ